MLLKRVLKTLLFYLLFFKKKYIIKMKRGRLVKLENFNSNETFKGVIKYKNDF